MNETKLPDDWEMDSGSQSGSCRGYSPVGITTFSPSIACPHPFYRCRHWHPEAKKVAWGDTMEPDLSDINLKLLVPSLYHDTNIIRVGRGLISSLMHRKEELRRGFRKDFKRFCTGEHLDQSHRVNEARLPGNVVIPHAL